MMNADRLLSYALVAFGIIFCLIYPLAALWPSGWAWHSGMPASNDYFMMIVGFYAVLGIFLIRASSRPARHASLIWFTIMSSVAHAAIMAVQALLEPMRHGHLVGDVPALLLVAIALGTLMGLRTDKA